MAATLGTLNPFRWRGYVYDEETYRYYLRSRYYSPPWHKFLNADSTLGKPGQLFGHNVFTYCRNNPVNRVDKDGRMEIGIATSLSVSTLEAFEYLGISLPDPPYTIIKESTDSNNVTTVILLTSRPKHDWAISILPTEINIGEEETTYTYKFTWKYYRNLRDNYEYYSVNSRWIETSLAIGEILPIVGAAITLSEDFIVKPIVKLLPHTSDQDRNRKIYKILFSDVESEIKERTK